LEKLTWFPLYIDKLLSSPHWQQMEDYQKGWYIQLLLNCTRSNRLGYLKMDSSLWKIAGARRRDFWDSHKSAVLACFKVCEMEGHQWIYNERLLYVMGEQSNKYKKKSGRDSASLSPSVLDVDSKKAKDNCFQCKGTGTHGSLSRPGVVVRCECLST
jgi:hypothetical protein